MTNYRRIWEQHYTACLLPGIEIHHVDGNHKNNLIENLLPVTPEEHFFIHTKNGDYGAASLISNRAVLPIDEVIRIRKLAGKIGGTNSRDNQLGFFAMSAAEKTLRSQKVGCYTRDNKLGIHRINADPVLSKQNSSYAGKQSYLQSAGFHARPYQLESVGDTFWWYNPNNNCRVRRRESPGDSWIQSMGVVNAPINKTTFKHTYWWHDNLGNRKRSSTCPGPTWKQGMK